MSTKSKDMIAESFIHLLKAYPYNEITISEICANTSLARKTFYNNFASKEEVIFHIVNKLIRKYIDMVMKEKQFTQKKMSHLFFEFGYQNKDIISLFISHDIFYLFQQKFNEHLPAINILISNNKLNSLSDEDIAYVFAFNSAGVTRMLELWIKTGLKKTTQEMSDLYTIAARNVSDY